MFLIPAHPMETPPRFFMKSRFSGRGFALGSITGDFFNSIGSIGDIFNSIGSMVDGLGDALKGALEGVLDTIKQIGETVALIVRASVGDVRWSEVSSSLGKVFREVANVAVIINPTRIWLDIAREVPITAHAFAELDKFSGGMLTNYRNVSTLVDRAIRGDPISKAELIQDALFAIQVASMFFGGGPAVGAMIGNMVGRQICSKQTQAKEACSAAFVIAGAAVGGWATTANSTLTSHAQVALEKYMVSVGVTEASRQAILLCQASNVVGDNECEIIGEIFANYIKADMNDMSWEEFLAQEIARLGIELLMEQWFPPGSPERVAMDNWKIKIVDVPVDSTQIIQTSIDPKLILLAAGAIATLMIGVGS